MDFISDASGRHWLRLCNLTEPPEFVKASSILAEDVIGLGSHQFADEGHREFPIDTPGHVWASYGYCLSSGVENPTILGRIKKAAAKFGLADEVIKLDGLFSGLEKSAAQDEEKRFAVYVDMGAEGKNGKTGVQGFYPINTEDEVVKAATAIVEHRNKIPLECFVEGTRSIVKRANALEVEHRLLPKTVVDYGTIRLPEFEFLKFAAEQRVKITNDEMYLEIAKTAIEAREGHAWDEFVEMWKQADDLNGVTYTKTIWDPYRIFNSGVTETHADVELEKWAAIAGSPVPVEEIAKFPLARLAKFFSKEAAIKLAELVKQAATASGSEITEAAENLDLALQKQFLKFLAQ